MMAILTPIAVVCTLETGIGMSQFTGQIERVRRENVKDGTIMKSK
jgi:hypothetical protein